MTKEEKDVVMEHVTVNVGDLYEKLGPMLPETISVLNEFYEPFNQQLAHLLDDEQFLWRDITPWPNPLPHKHRGERPTPCWRILDLQSQNKNKMNVTYFQCPVHLSKGGDHFSKFFTNTSFFV